MKKDEEAAKLRAVCERYGIPVPQTDADWKPLAMALIEACQSAFPSQRPAPKWRRRSGRKPKLTWIELWVASNEYLDIRHSNPQLSKADACRKILSRRKALSRRCSFQVFWKSVSVVAEIPPDRLFQDDPNDNDVVRRFKSELRRFRDLPRRYRAIFDALPSNLRDSQEAHICDIEAKLKQLMQDMLRDTGINFFGRNDG
jgi:hypothetical protein